jgi:predicted restriction endonuclease
MSFGSSDANRPCPSTVANGLALTPTLHKLFDHGAWSLDDSRRVIV